jgi:hypothetical protein
MTVIVIYAPKRFCLWKQVLRDTALSCGLAAVICVVLRIL